MDIYRERAHLVAYLAAMWPSYIGHTDPNEPDWEVVTIDTDHGQMTWHISKEDSDLFGHVDRTSYVDWGSHSWRWDGHSTEEKYERLKALTIDESMGAYDEH